MDARSILTLTHIWPLSVFHTYVSMDAYASLHIVLNCLQQMSHKVLWSSILGANIWGTCDTLRPFVRNKWSFATHIKHGQRMAAICDGHTLKTCSRHVLTTIESHFKTLTLKCFLNYTNIELSKRKQQNQIYLSLYLYICCWCRSWIIHDVWATPGHTNIHECMIVVLFRYICIYTYYARTWRMQHYMQHTECQAICPGGIVK